MTEELQENDDFFKDDGKDLHRLKSWIGRVEAGSKETQGMLKEITEKIESLKTEPSKPQFGDDEKAKLNEKLHDMILNGQITDAFNVVHKINQEAESLMKQADKKAFENAVKAIGDDPIMKNEELAGNVRNKAAELVNNGVDAKSAVVQAKLHVENTVLRQMAESGKGVSLDLLSGGGGSPPTEKEDKLPPGAERAYQLGKKKGYFTDRQDYLDNTDPRVLAEWGLSA
jgi:hypothetical protein